MPACSRRQAKWGKLSAKFATIWSGSCALNATAMAAMEIRIYFSGRLFFSLCFWLSNLRQVHLAVWQAAETFNLILIIAQECAQNRKWNKMLAKAKTTASQILLTLLLTELCHLAEHFPGQRGGGSGVKKSLAQHRNCRCRCCWVRSLHKNANWSGLMRSPDLLDLN